MKTSSIVTNFTSGELSPLLDGRVDVSKYYNGVKNLENFIVLPYGGAKRRPGTYYVASTKSNGVARLIAFQFSTTQSYILEFGPLYIRFYKDQGQIDSGGSPYEIVTTYAQADLFDLQFAQDADTMWIVHPSYKPQKLTRTAHTSWTISNYAPTADPFTSANNYPSCVSIHEQRIIFANTNDDPQKVWASLAGNYENMTVGTAAGDAYVYTIGSEQVNAIRWLSSGRELAMGTLGGVFTMSSGEDGVAITPTNVVVKRETSYGATGIVPKKIGDNVFYVQRNLKTIREFIGAAVVDVEGKLNESSFDATLLAEHITNGGIIDMDYQQSPYNLLWCVRNDGEIAVLTRQIDQDVLAWSRITTDGLFESVAVIPGDGEDDEVWVVVNRTIGGATKRYVEYLKPMDFGDEQEDAFFVDSGLSLDSPKTITDITKANPGVVTAASHGFSNNDVVIIRGVKGMTEVNRTKFKVANKTTNTFELAGAGTEIDTSDKLLLHCDGTDGSTTFTDSAETPKTVTANGNAQIDTAQSKFGGASGLFDGTGDYLSLADHADWNFGTGDFTIDFWVRFAVLPADGIIATIISQRNVVADDAWYVGLDNSAGTYRWRLVAQIESETPAKYISVTVTATVAINTWYHIAVVRTGNNFMIFQDGTQVGTTVTDSDSMPNCTVNLQVGWYVGSHYLNGWIDELRVSKGIARWTANFTAPAAPYAVTGGDVDTSGYTTYISGGEARKCVTSLSGLTHLEAESLNILIDGIKRANLTVASGAITVTQPTNGGGEIHAGLPYPTTTKIKTMRIEAGSQQGTAQSKLKRIHKVFIRVFETIGMNVGNSDTQDIVTFDQTDDFIPMFSGDKEITMPSLWDRDGYIVITPDGPLPLTVIAIIIYLNTEDA